MKTLNVAGLTLGEGLPKICVPLVGQGMPALLNEINRVSALPADLYEWRADYYYGNPLDALECLESGLGGRPVLCTVRTNREGGEALISMEEYEELLVSMVEKGGFSLLDIELSCGRDRVRRLVALAKGCGIATVVSKHDFQKTPSASEIYKTLVEMKELGADIPKYAVMPQNPRDVLTLLEATLEASGKLGPVITMSMGGLGKISRISGRIFGSCITFGSGDAASAPGQINAEDLRAILRDMNPLT